MALVGKDTKQPDEVLDWDVDFGDWMRSGDALDIVNTNVRLLSGPDTTPLLVTQVQSTATRSKVWLSGGANGAKYRIELEATTVEGRLKEAEFDIAVKEI